MLTQERYQQILDLLARKRAVTVAELTRMLGASEATIRRDLNALHEMGRLNKVHGGATALAGPCFAAEVDIAAKAARFPREKTRIGAYAATLIQDDDFVYIDAGTSTDQLVEALEESRATFVTNGAVHAQHMAQKGLKCYLLGGRFKASAEAVVDAVAANNLQRYNFTKCFLGTDGISAEAGFTTPDAEEAVLKAEAVARSYLTYILADHSKFGLTAPVSFAALGRACILTDRLPDERYRTLTIIKEAPEL